MNRILNGSSFQTCLDKMCINLTLIRHFSRTYWRWRKILKCLIELHLLVLTHTGFTNELGPDHHLLVREVLIGLECSSLHRVSVSFGLLVVELANQNIYSASLFILRNGSIFVHLCLRLLLRSVQKFTKGFSLHLILADASTLYECKGLFIRNRHHCHFAIIFV